MKKIFLALSILICFASCTKAQVGRLHLINAAPWGIPSNVNFFGDSFTAFYNPCSAPTAYTTLLLSAWGLSLGTNYALSSTGIHYTDSIMNVNYGNNITSASSVMSGFNDVRSFGFNNDPGYRMLAGGYNAIFAAHFLKNSAFAGNGTGVIRTGTWTTTVNTQAWGGKAGAHGASTATLNDSITYVNPSADSSILVSLIGLFTGGANFDLYLDDILVGHLTENSMTSGLADGHGYDDLKNPFVIMFTGLPLAIHKLKLVNTSVATTFYVDYFGELRAAATATPLLLWHGPINDATGNAIAGTGAYYGVAAEQRLNRLIDSLAGTWNPNYPVRVVPTNKFLDTLSGICSSDHIHPNAIGEPQLMNAALSVAPSLTSGFGTSYYQGANRMNAIINGVSRQVAYMDEVIPKSDRSKFILNSYLPQLVNLVIGTGSTFTFPIASLPYPLDFGASYLTTSAAFHQGDLSMQSNDAANTFVGYNTQVVGGVYKAIRTGVASKIGFTSSGGVLFAGAASVTAGSTQTYVNSFLGLVNGNSQFGTAITGTSVSQMDFPASTTSFASANIPEGADPTSGATGNFWTNSTSHNLMYFTNSTKYTIAKCLTTTAVLDFPSTGAGAVSDLTVSLTGAAVGDVVDLGVANASLTTTSSFTAWVSATNTITVRYSPKATEDPASGTFRVSIIKF